MIKLLFPLFFVIGLTLNAQDQPQIATLRLESEQHPYTPFLLLGEVLKVSFDDLDADQKEYYYEIRHMDFEWNESDLKPSEYIQGYHRDRIRNFSNSQNTLQFFTHYRFQLPNQNTKITRTGNYLIKILDTYDQVVAERKITVYRPKVLVNTQVFRSRDLKFSLSKQAVQFSIIYPDVVINQPRKEIKVALLQNGDWNSAILNLLPQYLRSQEIQYRYNAESSFFAANEFLNFDSKYLRTATNRIQEVRLGEQLYETILYPDIDQENTPYTYNPDINGGFKIKINNQNQSSDLNADYTYVSFELKTPKLDQEIYVYGAFNNYQMTAYNKMYFDEISNSYKGEYLFKQGFYNYRYQIKGEKNHKISGDHYQTENDYQVLVYYQPFGDRYYEILGFGKANSAEIRN
ncbi:MAG: DUF5103 domain-containing protein [Flavobacteriaceae bacterium]